MATMVKEKRRDKKKSKEKHISKKTNECDTYIKDDEQKESTSVSDISSDIINSESKDIAQISKINEEVKDEVATNVRNIIIDEQSEDKTSLVVEPYDATESTNSVEFGEDLLPSAPILEDDQTLSCNESAEETQEESQIRAACMSLDDAIRVFGGKEIAEVIELSKKEEAVVDAGPHCDPDHPLIDLLSTFRTSLIAVDRDRHHIICGFSEEEKSRVSLWKVEKRSLTLTEKCSCGASVDLRAIFDVAELQKNKLPAAKLRLESLLREVEDSYCHHQHAALMAHYDVDELMSEIITNSKEHVREALTLLFQALRLSDGAPESFALAVERWISILSTSLMDDCDLQQLLFLLHNLFRQTRSVQWVGRVVQLQVSDTSSAARLVALLELLLTRPALETAQECTEDGDSWEELDALGDSGAVGEGRLRERDLLALLHALPIRDLMARLVLFARQDLTQESEGSWGDKSGGHGVLKACCGVRSLLHVLQRGVTAHAGYRHLRKYLRGLAVKALEALAALHSHSSSSYSSDLEENIAAELEACFAAGFIVLGDEIHELPSTLLRDDVVRDYCATVIDSLHDISQCTVESMSVDLPAAPCGARVKAATSPALQRELDHELGLGILDFLFQTGLTRKSPSSLGSGQGSCEGSCEAVSREQLPKLLEVHPRLHAIAFHMVADYSQLEPVEPSILQPLSRDRWRPTPSEVHPVLEDWSLRCPQLIQHLLLHMDYTPHTGVSLEAQLTIGTWLCQFSGGESPEWAWQVLRLLRVHRAQWGLPLEAPSHEPPENLLSTTYALLASDWGHCIPLACGPGVDALHRLAMVRPAEAVLCLAPIMVVMAQSPESISLTPKFTEMFAVVLNSGPTLVQRALGRRSATGQEMIQRLLLDQMQDTSMSAQQRSAVQSAWLHALWKPSLPACGRTILDVALRASRDWRALDQYAARILQEENAAEYLADAVRHAAHAPLLCETLLRGAHAAEQCAGVSARLADQLARQRAAARKIHVNNALKAIGSTLSEDELAVHRCASAALCCPAQHPAHLLLWRLLLHAWLQRASQPPAQGQAYDLTPPIGPLLFSGIIKTRTLAQIKKRLQETATYHHDEAESLKVIDTTPVSSESSKKADKSSPSIESTLFPSLEMIDFFEVSKSESDLSLKDRQKEEYSAKSEKILSKRERMNMDTLNLIAYHTAAEKLIREYLMWIEEGEKVRVSPHYADIARYLPEQALEAAWRKSITEISQTTPPVSPVSGAPQASTATSATQASPTQQRMQMTHLTYFERAVEIVKSINENTLPRYQIPELPVPLDDSYFTDSRLMYKTVDKYFKELERLADEWLSERSRVSQLDAQLWELVARLRVRRPLPPVRKSCPQGCKPITIHIAEDEWCVSSGAVQGIEENRRSARAAVRRLSRPRPYVARVASIVQSIGRRIKSAEAAEYAAQRAWQAAARTAQLAPAHAAVCALVGHVAVRYLSSDGARCADLLSRWCAGSPEQRALCSQLLQPSRARPEHWPRLYRAVLQLPLPPHAAFSHLSKFDMLHWSESVDTAARSEVLEAQVNAALRLGPEPDEEYQVLLEVLGVHSAVTVRATELRTHVLRVAHACVSCALPPLYAEHLRSAVDRYGYAVDMDQLGHLLRELGALWWEARGDLRDRALLGRYAPHLAGAMRALLRQMTVAAVGRTYEPDRVAWYIWGAIQESWAAWLVPDSTPPLLPPDTDAQHQANMLACFVDTIQVVIQTCPGCEETLLRYIWQWAVHTFIGMEAVWPAASRAQAPALLAALAPLAWHKQWYHSDCLQLALQVSNQSEQELSSWCSATLRHVAAESWLRGVADPHIAPALAALLELFTSRQLALPLKTLEEACRLPWSRLPQAALDCAVDKFFVEHYSLTTPYHKAPQFRVLLAASQFLPTCTELPVSQQAGDKHASLVSQWVRAGAAPALAAHVPDQQRTLLDTITELAPYIESSQGETEQLLGRAIIVMSLEPAAEAALPVWEQWVRWCPARARRACAAAAATLTTLDYFAAIADATAKAVMNETETSGWSEVSAPWSRSPWSEAGPLLARGRLHAAYAVQHAHAHSPAQLRHAVKALLNTDVNFSENEAIVALWICVLCRAGCLATRVENGEGGVRGESGVHGENGESGMHGEGVECSEAARAALLRWAEQRRSLLQLVSLQPAAACPTPRHRLLCRLAQCVISPSDSATRNYEAAFAAVPGLSPDAQDWGRAPLPKLLPRLAARMFPSNEIYFKIELDLASDTI